jgi:hypothetical protein
MHATYEKPPTAPTGADNPTYVRRRPEQILLYQVVDATLCCRMCRIDNG